MAFDIKEVALRARNLVTERSPARSDLTVPHIQALIPTALELWARAAMKDPEKYSALTDVITAPLTDGVADISDLINGEDDAISLKDLRQAIPYLTIAGVRTPCSWVRSQNQLNTTRILGTSYPACFLEGNSIRTRSIAGSLTSPTATQTSGALIVGHSYTIKTFAVGDDFSNVGAGSPTAAPIDMVACVVDVAATGSISFHFTGSRALIDVGTYDGEFRATDGGGHVLIFPTDSDVPYITFVVEESLN